MFLDVQEMGGLSKDISNRIHTGDIDILAASTSGNSITSLDQNTKR